MTASERQSGAAAPTQEVLRAVHELFTALANAVPVLGDAKIARIQPKLTQAKMLGELAVAYSNYELKQRVQRLLEALSLDDVASDAPAEAATAPAEARPAPDQQPIAGYDDLTAAQIVKHLSTASSAERAAIGAYEAAGRRRATIMNKVAQLDKVANAD